MRLILVEKKKMLIKALAIISRSQVHNSKLNEINVATGENAVSCTEILSMYLR
jgi:hypothetical protein